MDLVEELMWTTSAMALKVVDQFNDQLVSAFVTATGAKFLLLHETRNDDTIEAFFHEVYELYAKVSSDQGRGWYGVCCVTTSHLTDLTALIMHSAADEPLLRIRHANLHRGF